MRFNKRFANCNRELLKNGKDFCNNTSIHGLKYFINDDLRSIEKVYFALSFCSVVILSGYFMLNVYEKWSTTPVLFGVNPKSTAITKEPFPAVTICNLNQAYSTKVEKYSVYSTEYAMLQMLCKREVNVTIAGTINDWTNLEHFIADISQPCSNMLVTCSFGAVQYNCSDLFRSIVTDEGLCCTFNTVHPAFMYVAGIRNAPLFSNETIPNDWQPIDWSAEKGYPNFLPEKYYPRTAVGIGESLGLRIILDVEADKYYCSSSNSIGFKISLHSPTETANVREVGLLLPAGSETKIRIQTIKTESETQLRSIRQRNRMCLFQEEQKLELFKQYSKVNCELECIAKMMLRYCGCLSHFMPKFHGNETVCSIYEATCVERIRLKSMLSASNDETMNACYENCLPSCNDMSYLPNFFQAPLTRSQFLTDDKERNVSGAYMERNMAILHMYFKDHSFRSNIQTEFVGMTNVLSSVGGLISLFFGFSCISLTEFIFYAFLRPCRTERYRTRHVTAKNEKHITSRKIYGPLGKRSRISLRSNYKTHVRRQDHLNMTATLCRDYKEYQINKK